MKTRSGVDEIMSKYTPEDIVAIGKIYVALCEQRSQLNMKAFALHLDVNEQTLYKLEQLNKDYCRAIDKVRGMIFNKRRTIPTDWQRKWKERLYTETQ